MYNIQCKLTIHTLYSLQCSQQWCEKTTLLKEEKEHSQRKGLYQRKGLKGWGREGRRVREGELADRVWECPEGLTRHPWKFSTILITVTYYTIAISHHLHPRHYRPQLPHNITTEVVRLGFNETHQAGGSDDVATSGGGETNQGKPKLKHCRLLLNPLSTHSDDIIHGYTDTQTYRQMQIHTGRQTDANQNQNAEPIHLYKLSSQQFFVTRLTKRPTEIKNTKTRQTNTSGWSAVQFCRKTKRWTRLWTRAATNLTHQSGLKLLFEFVHPL